ncbi:hypothetical protein PIROE2DRAFT_5609 [Piromyces sp. E2]|nr:hypothetical protein PIROE2DRAFT_5609 [Piromyces sp. E2]|eukprot:OUM67005.1 hypothetical protein PIROE2DRAFT_5609 [Piromyces sp. E2]
MTKGIPIGIDLGTTNSCVGVWLDDHIEIIANDQGNRTTPSYVAFDNNERLIGEPAKYKAAMNPKNTIYGVKRFIGRDFYDDKVQSDLKYFPYKVIEKNEKPYIQSEYKYEKKDFTPEEISSMVLKKMKETAEDYLGQPVTDAVITVPAYFNDSQRRATRDAGTIIGLNVLRIINEPTAAALAYGLNNNKTKNGNILIADLGGGTFDVSVLTINDDNFIVKATGGDTNLGGEDFNNRMVDYFVEEFKDKYSKDISSNSKAMNRLRIACERAKHILSSSSKAPIAIECLYEGIDFESAITRSRFEELNSDLFEKIPEKIKSVLEDANLSTSDIDEVVLVGAVAYGAAVQASLLSGNISEKFKNLSLVDVTPLSLGISVKFENIMSTIIKRNSPIPIRKTEKYYNSYDYQTSISIKVYEGERYLAKDNILLGKFYLNGVKPALRGETKIYVTFEIDENGILNVLACEKGTGLYKKITIDNSKGRLYKNEIDNLIKEAKKYEDDDNLERERVEALNHLENYTYHLRSTLRKTNISTRIPVKTFPLLEKAINSTIDWIKNNHTVSKEEFENKELELRNIANLYI